MKTILTSLFALSISFSFAQKTAWTALVDSVGENLFKENGDYVLIAYSEPDSTMLMDIEEWLDKKEQQTGQRHEAMIETKKNYYQKNSAGQWIPTKCDWCKKEIRKAKPIPSK